MKTIEVTDEVYDLLEDMRGHTEEETYSAVILAHFDLVQELISKYAKGESKA